jgi:anti-sigma factor RsiW
MKHLTEEERQDAADGSLDPTRLAVAEAHMTECTECREDVARLRALLARMRESAATSPADAWPELRARLERKKVTPLRYARWAVIAIAASLAMFFAWRGFSRAPSAERRDPQVELTAISDSTKAYQEQIADLQADLQLTRAMMRTETASAIDRDLKICDQAIAELNEAAKRDPNNLAIRQLLADSYRRKLDVLKRVNNAS